MTEAQILARKMINVEFCFRAPNQSNDDAMDDPFSQSGIRRLLGGGSLFNLTERESGPSQPRPDSDVQSVPQRRI